MKRLCLIVFGLIFISSVYAQQTKTVDSRISKVTVFQQGAQIFRTATFQLQDGLTDVIFEGVSPYLDEKSIQVSGKGNYLILDIRKNIRYPEPVQNDYESLPPVIKQRISALEDSLLLVNESIEEIRVRKDIYEAEKRMLQGSKVFSGSGKNDTLPVLKDALTYFRIKMTEINNELFSIRKIERKLTAQASKIQIKLDELRNYTSKIDPKNDPNQPVNQIIVTVQSKADIPNATLSVNYFVANAGWNSAYDLRADDVSTPMDLTLKANVYQQTMEDWKGVSLKLSTQNPRLTQQKPSLFIWILNYYTPYSQAQYYQNTAMATSDKAKQPAPSAVREEYSAKDVNDDSQTNASYATSTITNTYTNQEYDIDFPYNIPSDGKTHLVVVAEKKLQTNYRFVAIPKLSQNVYLQGNIAKWDDIDLMEGNANVFFNNTYVGQTYINPREDKDTLEISLGADRQISILRKKVKDKVKEKFAGNTATKTIAIEIIVKNNKQTSADVSIKDQIPVSKDETIKTELIENEQNAKYEESTGFLDWNIKLKPGERRVLSFTYSIKYDKDKPLIIDDLKR